MKLVKEGDPIGEHDIYLGPATVGGKPIGKWYQSRSAEQAAQDEVLATKLRSAYRRMMKRQDPEIHVPVFKEEKYEWRKVLYHKLGKGTTKVWRRCRKDKKP